MLVAIVGERNSGKTRLIEEVCRRLKGKVRVGVIKHIHHRGVSFDVEGTDTWRVKKAGAYTVAGLAPDRSFLLLDSKLDLYETIKWMKDHGTELIILEGFREVAKNIAFTILVLKSPENLKGNAPDAVYIEGYKNGKLSGVEVLRDPDEVIQKIMKLIG